LPPWRIERHEQAASTQTLAIKAAHADEPGRTAFMADLQSAGRGRDGRVWQAPAGNLNISMLLRPGAIAPVPAQWSLMAGVAVHDAVASFLPSPAKLMLKWPNDLLIGGAKLAGVLIDSALNAEGRLDWVVIGVGVNVADAPGLPDRQTASLAAHGISVAPIDLASRLLRLIDLWSARDLTEIRAGWLLRAHPAGTPLRVRQGDRVIDGAFETLTPEGGLVLHGQPPAASGEVYLAEDGPDAAGC
jgi:BirA family biotin operon repressor/biotin-[acetyl-CoA-carboxylase] ligase